MNVAVLGAGQRGRDVALRCVRAGHEVRLRGTDANTVMDRIDDIEHTLEASGVRDRIDGTTGLESAVSGAELVVDATSQDTDGHRELLAEVETMIDDETLVAVSDTTLSVTAVATGLVSPDRAVGFNIVDPPDGAVVEVVIAEQTTAKTRDRTTAFVDDLDATPIVVRDSPGFAAMRLELATIVEAIQMVEDGIATIQDIDRAFVRDESGRRGPLARADQHGLDTVLTALDDLATRLDDRFDPPTLLRQKVEQGQLGPVTGEGFYVWEDGTPVEAAEPDPEVPTHADEFDVP